MKIDFHTHIKLAKKLPFSSVYTEWLFKEAKEAGLDALCITEHFNTIGFEEMYGYIAAHYPREEDTFMINGLRVFTGMEIDIAEGGHILALGKIEDILAFNKQLQPFKEKGSFIAFEELVKMAKCFQTYLGAAHPYREGSQIPELPYDLLRELDFIDLNGKDYAIKGNEAESEVRRLAQALGLAVVGGSDTHQAFQYDCISTEIKGDIRTVTGLIESIRSNKPVIHVSSMAEFKVQTASVLKKALKEIYALGGDYVDILS